MVLIALTKENIMRKIKLFVIFTLMYMNVTPALAQVGKTKVTIKTKTKIKTIKGKDVRKWKDFTVVDFQTGRVNGTLYRPAGSSILLRRGKQFKSLIQVRANFVVEMANKAEKM